jgi:hypothetical protein
MAEGIEIRAVKLKKPFTVIRGDSQHRKALSLSVGCDPMDMQVLTRYRTALKIATPLVEEHI